MNVLKIEKSTLSPEQIITKLDTEFVNHCMKYKNCEWIVSVNTKYERQTIPISI